MERKKNSNVILNVNNIYNTDNKTLEELKLLFNKKLLKMIYNLEKTLFISAKPIKKRYNEDG